MGIHFAGNEDAANATRDACVGVANDSSRKFVTLQADLGISEQRDALFAEMLDEFGHIDALINNAGITSLGRHDIVDATEESWDTVLGVNLKAPFFLSKLAANYWIDNPAAARLPDGYKLVFVSSVSATSASLNRGDYCISKAAVGMMNQLWALRLAEHRVQTIEFRPGIMATDMTAGVTDKYDRLIADGLVPQKRWGSAGDVGVAVATFLEGGLPFSTGESMYLDGGLHHPRL